jgi:phosphatidylinositol-3-phosphatase
MRTGSVIRAAIFAAALLTPAAGFAQSKIKHIIVVAMENTDAKHIYGNKAHAPYLNTRLTPVAARATNFIDELPGEDSEPHYVWMEAGTNVFADTGFHCDNDPLDRCSGQPAPNWTKSGLHLSAQIEAAALDWVTYQQGIDHVHTGDCPIESHGLYAAKHDPFVFFAGVAGSPPSKTDAHCVAHTKNLTALAGDLKNNRIPAYVFFTPNLCNDMHGALACLGNRIGIGDKFLSKQLPPLIKWANAHAGVVLVTWDEPEDTSKMAFFAAGAGVRKNFAGAKTYTHSSIIKSVEEVFSLPILPAVAGANDLKDLFDTGAFP